MVKKYSLEEVAKHNTEKDLWTAIHGNVYDITEWQEIHPGGKKMIQRGGGIDATSLFNKFHDVQKVLNSVAVKYKIGELDTGTKSEPSDTASDRLPMVPASAYKPRDQQVPFFVEQHEMFGDFRPYTEPNWYHSYMTPYYNESHAALRAEMRAFVDKHIIPFVDEWEEKKEVPQEIYYQFGQRGYLAANCGMAEYPTQFTNGIRLASVPPEKFDAFHEIIVLDELCRCGAGGVVWNLVGGYGIGLPPVIRFATPAVRDRVVPQVITGQKRICLCITEPSTGSDVAQIVTTAKKTPDGKYYVVNGAKKWITNGVFADFFTVAVRTGDESSGMKGISMLLIERTFKGVNTRRIDTQGMWSSGSTYITFEDVKVPVENLLGKENGGFKVIMTNFNHERMGLVAQVVRMARNCYEDSVNYAHERSTFNQKLVEHGVIRNKLAQMAIRIEALQAYFENSVFQMMHFSEDEAMLRLGGAIAGLKAFATQTVAYCSSEATQVFGGLGYTRGGRGARVERTYRDTKAYAIPGGSEEIMLDLAMRQGLKVHEVLAQMAGKTPDGKPKSQ